MLAHSLTFVLGILISFWLITAILIALKANMFDWSAPAGPGVFSGDFWLGRGAEGVVNWAFWFENPWVNFCLLGLMLAMGLSMFGIFEIGVKATTMGNDLQHRKGYAGSFWSGALATVISTPCSAPFLGQAIGAAMLQPPLGIVLCLTMMGLGMSLPYIILGAFPVLTRYLPKPGAWMESFKQSMSFLMFGTAAYFLWIYMAFFDAENHPQDILFLFFGLVLFSMAFWVYGRWCPMYRSRKSRITGGIFSVIFLLAGLYYMLPPEGQPGSAAVPPPERRSPPPPQHPPFRRKETSGYPGARKPCRPPWTEGNPFMWTSRPAGAPPARSTRPPIRMKCWPLSKNMASS